MATHSSVLAWRIPGMGEPGELLSMGSHRVGHDWSNLVVVVVESYTKTILWPSKSTPRQKHKRTENRDSNQFSSVQSLSHVRHFSTLWTAAHQASLSITNSWSLLKLMSIRSVMLSDHLILCCPLPLLLSIFPSIRVFSKMSEFFPSWGQSIGVSASASVLPMNIQNWFPLGWTGWISLQPKGLSRVFSNTTVQKHQFLVLSFLYSPTLTSIHDYWKNHSFD